MDENGHRIPQPGIEPNPSYDELHNPPPPAAPDTNNTPTPQTPTTTGPDLGPRPLEIGVGPDEQPQAVLPVQGPDGISHIELGSDGTYWIVDPDGTRTPVNSYGIAPPRRTHANQMFDPYTGRWITPPQNPTDLAPENRSPFREAITSTLSTQFGDPNSLNAPQSPEIIVHDDGSMEVRVARGGSDGADRPWTDVRILNTQGHEIAHYREGIDGNRHYPLGAGHSVTITPDGKVLDPPHVDRSPLYNLSPPDGDNKIGYIGTGGWTTALDPIPLPPGVPGQTLYAHAGRLIIRDNNGRYHWVDATPETPAPTPAQRSIDLPWDGGDTNSYQAPDGTWYYNVNGHKVAFTPDRQQVITPDNGLRPTGSGGIYIDDRPGHGFQSILDNIPSKPIPVPEGVPAAALFQLEDGRLVIVDKEGGNHYVSPLPAPPPEGWQAGLIRAFMNIATAYGGRRGGWANPERPPLGGGPTIRSSTLDELQATFGPKPKQPGENPSQNSESPVKASTHIEASAHVDQRPASSPRPQGPDQAVAQGQAQSMPGTPVEPKLPSTTQRPSRAQEALEILGPVANRVPDLPQWLRFHQQKREAEFAHTLNEVREVRRQLEADPRATIDTALETKSGMHPVTNEALPEFDMLVTHPGASSVRIEVTTVTKPITSFRPLTVPIKHGTSKVKKRLEDGVPLPPPLMVAIYGSVKVGTSLKKGQTTERYANGDIILKRPDGTNINEKNIFDEALVNLEAIPDSRLIDMIVIIDPENGILAEFTRENTTWRRTK